MSLLCSSVVRLSRVRIVTSYRILKHISVRQSMHCYCHMRPKSARCLNIAHLQFSSSLNSSTTPARTLTYYSRRKGKRKTVKAVIRRFRRTGSGKWKRWQAGKNHFNSKKSSKRRSRLRRYVICNKQQTKMLNKMVNGW